MGYFDGLTDASFKIDSEGNTIFYPWGTMGKGYVLPESRKDSTRRSIKYYTQFSVPLGILAPIFFEWWLAISIALSVFVLGYAIWVTKLTRGLAVSTEKLTLSESTTNSARSHNIVTLWALEILCILFVIAGAGFATLSPKDWIAGILLIFSFGLGGFLILEMLNNKLGIKKI